MGGYYPGLWPLFSGALLFGQAQTVQVINPSTGQALAAAPPLPRNNYWEYPLSGPQVSCLGHEARSICGSAHALICHCSRANSTAAHPVELTGLSGCLMVW